MLPDGLLCLSGRHPALLHFGICFFPTMSLGHSFLETDSIKKNYRVSVYEKEVIICHRPFAGYYLMSYDPYQETSRLSLT